jgi:hypothetical protein
VEVELFSNRAVEFLITLGSIWACYDPALTHYYVYTHVVPFDPQVHVYTCSSFPFFSCIRALLCKVHIFVMFMSCVHVML